MVGWWDKLKDVALKAGQASQAHPQIKVAADRAKATIEAFREGYRQQMEPEKNRLVCPHCQGTLPPEARYCPGCGAKVDH